MVEVLKLLHTFYVYQETSETDPPILATKTYIDEQSELLLTPKASSDGAAGTLWVSSADNHLYLKIPT